MKNPIKILLFIIPFAIGYTGVIGQSFAPDLSKDTNLLINISSSAQISSNGLNNDFFNKFIWGGNISKNEKNYVINSLAEKNMLGAEFESKVSIILPVRNPLDTSKIRFGISFSQTNHIDALFSKQMANLVLNGNKSTRGQQIDLGANELSNLNYNVIKLQAFSKSYYADATHTIGIGFGIVNGISNTTIRLHEADIFTQNEGEYIDIRYSGILQNTNSIKSRNILDYRGIGTCLDVFYQIENKSGYQYTLFVENAGLVKWEPNASSYSNDTSFRFEGVNLTNLFDNENPFSAENIDSISQSYYPKKNKGSYISALPIKMMLSMRRDFSPTWAAGIILKKQLHSNYEPRLETEIDFKPQNNFTVTFTSGYGGYSSFWFVNNQNKFSTGLYFKYSIKNKIVISLGSPYLNYLAYSGWMSGMGAFFNLKVWI